VQNQGGPLLEFGLGADAEQLAAGKVLLAAGEPRAFIRRWLGPSVDAASR
jgi:hypothetical protein